VRRPSDDSGDEAREEVSEDGHSESALLLASDSMIARGRVQQGRRKVRSGCSRRGQRQGYAEIYCCMVCSIVGIVDCFKASRSIVTRRGAWWSLGGRWAVGGGDVATQDLVFKVGRRMGAMRAGVM